MAPRLTATTIARIEHALMQTEMRVTRPYLQEVASDLGVHISTMYEHKARVEALLPVGRPAGGPRKVITWEMEQAVKLLLDEQPWLYLDEIRDFLLDSYDVDVCISTVYNMLQHIMFTRKKLRVVAAQQNDELRREWQYNLQEFTAEQLVCVDESGSDDRTGDRFKGWASSGARAVVRRWLSNRKRVSVLPAYTLEGYIASITFEGSCTADIFEGFLIDHLLPLCNPYPAPRSVVVLDNASVHHANMGRIEEAYRRRGVLLRFLPPYSPDFNPIEEAFSAMKAWLRRNEGLMTGQEQIPWLVHQVTSAFWRLSLTPT